MSLKLVDHLQFPVSPKALTDEAFQAPPQRRNSWSVFCAWAIDWALAWTFTKIAIASWFAFIGPLGFDALPRTTQAEIQSYLQYLQLVLIPLSYFSLSFISLLFHGKTPGLKIFKHQVEITESSQALKWAFGATVSAAVAGLPLFNGWLDQFAETHTESQKFAYWQFVKAGQHNGQEANSWSMLDEVEQNAAATWQKAA